MGAVSGAHLARRADITVLAGVVWATAIRRAGVAVAARQRDVARTAPAVGAGVALVLLRGELHDPRLAGASLGHEIENVGLLGHAALHVARWGRPLPEIEVRTDTLDNRNMVCDFSDIKRIIKGWIDDEGQKQERVFVVAGLAWPNTCCTVARLSPRSSSR